MSGRHKLCTFEHVRSLLCPVQGSHVALTLTNALGLMVELSSCKSHILNHQAQCRLFSSCYSCYYSNIIVLVCINLPTPWVSIRSSLPLWVKADLAHLEEGRRTLHPCQTAQFHCLDQAYGLHLKCCTQMEGWAGERLGICFVNLGSLSMY